MYAIRQEVVMQKPLAISSSKATVLSPWAETMVPIYVHYVQCVLIQVSSNENLNHVMTQV